MQKYFWKRGGSENWNPLTLRRSQATLLMKSEFPFSSYVWESFYSIKINCQVCVFFVRKKQILFFTNKIINSFMFMISNEYIMYWWQKKCIIIWMKIASKCCNSKSCESLYFLVFQALTLTIMVYRNLECGAQGPTININKHFIIKNIFNSYYHCYNQY